MASVLIHDQLIDYTHSGPTTGPVTRPPLVLVHGAGGDRYHWPHQLRRLAATEVYALDLPGHGRSPGPGCRTIADYAQIIKQFADTLALPPFILAGHSMGGAIALEVALRYGDALAGLALVGTGTRLRVNPAILDGLIQDFNATTAQLIDWMYSPSCPLTTRQQGLEQVRSNDPQTLHNDFAACNAFDVRAEVSSLTLPTLIICGVEDKMTPIKFSEILYQSIAGSYLHLVEAAGHMVMLEQPEVVAGLFGEFMRGRGGD